MVAGLSVGPAGPARPSRRSRVAPVRTAAATIASTAIVAVLILLAAAPSAALAATGGSISGTVVDAGSGRPVGGLAVIMTTYTGDGGNVQTRTRTGSAGTFAFADLSTDPQTVYEVSATYQNGAYASDTFGVKAGEVHRVTLNVYPTTTSAAVVRLDSWTVWVDRAGASVAVQQDIDVTNSSKQGYIGQTRTSDGQNDVLTLPLAPGATGFQYVGFLGDSRSFVEGGTFHHTATLLPGQSSGTLRYQTATLSRLDLPVTLPTGSFELLVPTDVKVTAPGLTSGERLTDRGVSYQTYRGTDLRPGQIVRVGLTVTGGGGGSRTRIVLLIAGAALTLLLVATVVGYARRRAAVAGQARPSRNQAVSAGRAPVRRAPAGRSRAAGAAASSRARR